MDELNEEQARCMAQATPLLKDMHEAWFEAFACYQSECSDRAKAEHDDATVATIVRSHMWAEVQRRFGERPGCVPIKVRGLKLLIYRDQLVWRFKKVDGFGRHRNYPTKQQNDFDDQIELPSLPPKAVRLTSGYQPDASGQGIERVVVARVLGTSIEWASQVNLIDEEASWADITPQRFTGTDKVDFRSRRAGR